MKLRSFLLIFALVFGIAMPIMAQAKDSKDVEKAAHRAADAAKVFNEIMDAPDNSIPQNIIDGAEVVAVFPSVFKAGFIVGGRGGAGVVSIRDAQTREWGAPIFFKIGGGDFGLQIGAQSTDLVLIGTNRRAADMFLKENFKLGGEVSAAAGPVGRAAEASTDLPSIRSEFLSYSRSRGLFAGAVINGAKVWQDTDLNTAVYGERKIETARQISEESPTKGVMVFTNTLNRYSKKHGA